MTTTPAASSPVKPCRHPAEFWIVRGGIALLVLLVGVQAHARFGYTWTLSKLQARIAAEEETSTPLLLSDAEGLVVGFPSQTEEVDRHWRRRTYSWRGLTQSYRITMPYDSSEKPPAIMSLVTADAPVPPEPVYDKEETNAEPLPMSPLPTVSEGPGGAPSLGSPGGGGRGKRPDLMASDKDGDGKISKEEAPERIAENFAQWDTNSDGLIDKDEIAAARERFSQQGGGGGRPASDNRPQRPAAEGDNPAALPAEKTTPAEDKPADAAAATKPAE